MKAGLLKRAKCCQCSWDVRSSSAHLLGIAITTHRVRTDHRIIRK